MAKQPTSRAAAEEFAADNVFGLTEDDLGVNPLEGGLTLDSDITDDELDEGEGGNLGQDDVTHIDPDVAPQPRQQQPRQQEQRQQPRQQQQQEQPLNTLHSRAEVKYDQKGNLVNAQGQVVATAGREARYYQDAHRARQQVTQATQAHQEVNTRLQKAIGIGEELLRENEQFKLERKQEQDMGVAPEEKMQAFALISQFKKGDAIGALKGILTMAAARGIDLTQLGVPGGAIDAKSISELVRQEITKATNPLLQANQQQQQERQRTEQATQEQTETRNYVSTFFTQNPEATKFLPVFEEIYKQPQFSNMPLNEAWLRIQLNLRDRQSQQRTDPNTLTRRMPNSRSTFVPEQEATRAVDGMANVSESYENILRDVMNTVMPSRAA